MPGPRAADVYLVPVNLFDATSPKDLAADVSQESHLRTALLPGFALSPNMLDMQRMRSGPRRSRTRSGSATPACSRGTTS